MRNNTAPPVPIIIALFCCFFGKFFVAIAITTALSPDNTISIAMIFKRAVSEDEVSSIANTMGQPSCKKQPCYKYFFFLLTNYTVFARQCIIRLSNATTFICSSLSYQPYPTQKRASKYYYRTPSSICAKGNSVFTSPQIRFVFRFFPFNHAEKSMTNGSLSPPRANQACLRLGK